MLRKISFTIIVTLLGGVFSAQAEDPSSTLSAFQGQPIEVESEVKEVEVTITTIKASGRSNAQSPRGLDARLTHLSDKLKTLPYGYFGMETQERWTLPFRKKHEATLAGNQSIVLRPLYTEGDSVCLWMKWVDQASGMKVIDSRLHLNFGEQMVVGTDESEETGTILAISVQKPSR